MSHEGHDMGGSDSTTSDGSSHGSEGGHMAMSFNTDTATMLFANGWVPDSDGAYAGTCIFLIVLAIIARLLVAAKGTLERRWEDQAAKRRFIAVNGKTPLAERISQDKEAKQVVLSENGVEENVFVVERNAHGARPWRFSVDPVRAALDTVIVGVGYLL